ncbi:uncharacterized protein [Hyperolius riggenbachi]|uniref:uncharacterized protein n=1 Tax=Hyperolius riggenbachi TaxID=752182 RepID=UPI0035A34674
MEASSITQISLVWVTISLTAFSSSQGTSDTAARLECLNDFDTKMFCVWEVDDVNSNCTEAFTLIYEYYNMESSNRTKERCHDWKNVQRDGVAVQNKCICNINIRFPLAEEIYTIEVESKGRPVKNSTFFLNSTVKPKAPSNVEVHFKKENGVVRWNTNYESNFIRDRLTFQIEILAKDNRKVVKIDDLEQVEPQYKFGKRQFSWGEDFIARVRSKPRRGFEGPWSEWSPEVTWRNDYSLTILDLKAVLIPVICITILFLIIIGYIGLIRCKRTWWNNIPDPAKSTLAHSKLLQIQKLNPNEKSSSKKSCGIYLRKLVKAFKMRNDQHTEMDNSKDYVNLSRCSKYKKVIYEPEIETFESCIEMYPITEDDNTGQEDKLEYKAESHLISEDLSIVKMFLDVLCDSSSTKMDVFENFNTGNLFGCPSFKGRFDNKETPRQDSKMSHESGYHSCSSQGSPSNSPIVIDGMKTFGEWPENKCQNITYIPPVSNKGIVSYQGNGIIYYNTKYLFSNLNEDTFYPDIGEKPGDISQIKVQNHESKICPTAVCQMSGYKSFDLAVQENCPALACQMSGYKSFDLAVQENCPALACQMSGYKSFVLAVHENGPTSLLEIPGYQSFDQAVHENGPTSLLEMPGYQSFDQAVHENGPTSLLEMPGYQSFDKAVQEGEDTFICQENGYQTFDQAVHQGEISGTLSCTSYGSGYKPFESLICQNSDDSDKDKFQVEDSHGPQTEQIISVMDNRMDKNFDNGQRHVLLPSSEPRDALNRDLNNEMKSRHDSIPLALTFDICEHLRNLGNRRGLKVPITHFKPAVIPIHQAILPGHLYELPSVNEQLTINKHFPGHNGPLMDFDNFENMSYFLLKFHFDSSPTSNHLLIQQMHVDSDGNSYMKIA